MNYTWKLSVAVLVCAFLVSCSGSESEQSEALAENQNTEFLGGGSCSEYILYNVDLGIPESILESEAYFECGDAELESLASSARGSMPTGSGSVMLSGTTLSVNSLGVEFFANDVYENHKSIQLYLHNGEIRQAEKRFQQFEDNSAGVYRHEVRYGIYNASYVLSVELASSSPNLFEVGTFEYSGDIENPNDPLYANSNLIFSAFSIYDTNASGNVDLLEEILDIESGNITILGGRPDWSITVDLMLSNGEAMTGQYLGDFVVVPVAEEYVP